MLSADNKTHGVRDSMILKNWDDVWSGARRHDSDRNFRRRGPHPVANARVDLQFGSATATVALMLALTTGVYEFFRGVLARFFKEESSCVAITNPDEALRVFFPANSDTPRFRGLEPRLVVKIFAVAQSAVEVEQDGSNVC